MTFGQVFEVTFQATEQVKDLYFVIQFQIAIDILLKSFPVICKLKGLFFNNLQSLQRLEYVLLSFRFNNFDILRLFTETVTFTLLTRSGRVFGSCGYCIIVFWHQLLLFFLHKLVHTSINIISINMVLFYNTPFDDLHC